MINLIIMPITLIALIVASYVDIKIREVPDWISYGLIFAGIGIRIIFSAYENTWSYLLESAFGIIVTLSFSMLLFYTGQWGGGDSKLLIGLGSMFGLKWETPLQFMTVFIALLFLVGGLYGLLWSMCLFAKNRAKCMPYFFQLHKQGLLHRSIICFLIILIIIYAIVINDIRTTLLLSIIGVSIIGLYYTWLFLQVLEKKCMQRYVQPNELTEGDWIVNDIVIEGKRICGPSDFGISKKQIKTLCTYHEKGMIDKILIKDGIPFVPSFLIGYVILLWLCWYFPIILP